MKVKVIYTVETYPEPYSVYYVHTADVMVKIKHFADENNALKFAERLSKEVDKGTIAYFEEGNKLFDYANCSITDHQKYSP